ncbi:MAG: class I SAM-dependent methyltransferase [Brachymonas sp.]|nr:class I SAM-dependent methyltransferase [Brachymonas sp.]
MVVLHKSEARERVRSFWVAQGNRQDAEHDLQHALHAAQERECWMSLFLQHIPHRSRVIDMGAGTGYCSLLLAKMGHAVTALDWAAGLLARAEQKASQTGVRLKTQTADMEHAPFTDGIFDALTARSVLWTLVHPERAIKEWHRILRPGGVAIADLAIGDASAHYEADVEAELPLRQVRSVAELEALFRQQGFADVRIQEDTFPHTGDHVHVMVIARR